MAVFSFGHSKHGFDAKRQGRDHRCTIPGILVAGAVLVCLLCGSAGKCTAEDSQKTSRLLHGRLIEYDDAEGYFEFKAQGDRGSILSVRMNFTGFYVFPQLMLSRMVQMHGLEQAKRMGKGLLDTYIVVPKDIKVTVNVDAKYRHQVTVMGYVTTTENLHDQNIVFTHATVPPEKQPKYSPEIFNWIGQYKSNQVKNNETVA